MANKDLMIKEINIDDIEYPNLLSEIKNKPKKLYVVGNIEILRRKAISIVGARECTKYGEIVAKKLAYNLAKQNIVIVSGLARGIDKYAHVGAIEAEGKTIAVVAHGLDIIYPKENLEIARKIVELGGAIVSEYPVGIKPEVKNFPARNRIISGLSMGTIVVEAEKKSGALITANYALEQGRNVYAVPGNVFSKKSEGTNSLLKYGAEPVIDVNDIIKQINIYY